MLKLDKYSFGVGDRFAHQAIPQLKALLKAKQHGINIVPVWNKSNREHVLINSIPQETRDAADHAVKTLNWQDAYYVDADHINLNTVHKFLDSCDFFTIDVADYISKPCSEEEIEEFIKANNKYLGELVIPGIAQPFVIDKTILHKIANKFLRAIYAANAVYKHIVSKKGAENFITEISMDEVTQPQTPIELFFILSGLAQFDIPAQTIAPKFSGRFNKGVDYVGDLKQFAQEFEQDVLVIDFAIKEFGLPDNLKLSIHSGSDKFALYPIMGNVIRKYDTGIHLKTAGTTWLEEVIGLALAGDAALDLVKTMYTEIYARREELQAPYATVIDIDPAKLPIPLEVKKWGEEQMARTLRHVQSDKLFNPNFRQLFHIGYKIAAERGKEYINMLEKYDKIIGEQVTENLYERHIKVLFNLEKGHD